MKPNEKETSPNLQKLLLGLASQARASSIAHQAASSKMRKYKNILGIPIVILCTSVGTALLSFAGVPTPVWISVVLATACISASTLAALLIFLQYGELSESHKFAAANYFVIGRELELLQLEYSDPNAINEPHVLERLTETRYRLDNLYAESPRIPKSIWNQVKRQLQTQQGDIEREIIQKA